MLTVRTVYEHALDHRERTVLIARASLGGPLNERIVKQSLGSIRQQAIETLEASRAFRKDAPLPWRRAAEIARKEAVLILGMCRTAEKAADGTIIFEPKAKRMGYNLAILNCYDRMVEALTCLRELEPVK